MAQLDLYQAFAHQIFSLELKEWNERSRQASAFPSIVPNLFYSTYVARIQPGEYGQKV